MSINNKKYKNNEFSNNVLENVPTGFFSLLPVIGEDIIFLINFIPKYNNIWIRLLTSTIFAGFHLNNYETKACILKVVLYFGNLTIHKNMINHNITHFIMDYLMLKIMKLTVKK